MSLLSHDEGATPACTWRALLLDLLRMGSPLAWAGAGHRTAEAAAAPSSEEARPSAAGYEASQARSRATTVSAARCMGSVAQGSSDGQGNRNATAAIARARATPDVLAS